MPEELIKARTREPEVVYHYTTVDTMMKIVTSRKIWATSISYLNDSLEGEHFLRMVRQRLPGLLSRYQLNDTVLNKLSDGPKPVESRPFVASFSSEGDSLPQWRSYCPQGNGVAIGFRVSCLKKTQLWQDNREAPQSPRFKSVEYMKDDIPEASLEESIEEIARLVDSAIVLFQEKYAKETLRVPREDIFAAFAEMEACWRKHASFSAEHEYRLIVDRFSVPRHNLEFRSVRSTIVPYLELSIPAQSALKMDNKEKEFHGEFGVQGGYKSLDFVAKVVVGPTSNMDLTVEAIKSFFRKHNLDVRVVPSTCPFRDW